MKSMQRKGLMALVLTLVLSLSMLVLPNLDVVQAQEAGDSPGVEGVCPYGDQDRLRARDCVADRSELGDRAQARQRDRDCDQDCLNNGICNGEGRVARDEMNRGEDRRQMIEDCVYRQSNGTTGQGTPGQGAQGQGTPGQGAQGQGTQNAGVCPFGNDGTGSQRNSQDMVCRGIGRQAGNRNK